MISDIKFAEEQADTTQGQDSGLWRNNKHEVKPPKPLKHDIQAPTQTLSTGAPVDNNAFSLTAGENGPLSLADITHLDKIAHFDRERIPERVVHAKGGGAFGYFEVTRDITQYCKADLFNKIGKKTPIAIRFSRVAGERGSADTERDPRGMAVKFYTQEGNWDLVGNNTPVFFIKDPIKFTDLIHSQKRTPDTFLRDPTAFWDFLSLVPESIHMVTMLFSDRGIPDGYRHMHGFGNHSFRLVNSKDEVFYTKFHMLTDSGIKNLTDQEAMELRKDPDYYNRDLAESIEEGNTPSWTLKIQVMPAADASKYKWDVLDVTKVWPHSDYPLIDVGKLVLTRNPENYHAEIEQIAFCPGTLVPGIEPSEDRMLASRIFSYADTQRYRLGVNYTQIPVNCPMNPIANGLRDGFMVVNGGQGKRKNYEPNSFHAYAPDPKYTPSTYRVNGLHQRHGYNHPNDDFEQVRTLYNKVLSEQDRANLAYNISVHLCRAEQFIQDRQLEIFRKVDEDYAKRVEAQIAKQLAMKSLKKTKDQLVDKVEKFGEKVSDKIHEMVGGASQK